MLERAKLAKHRKKAYDEPEKYLGLVIDGMDQKKTELPHFVGFQKAWTRSNLYLFMISGFWCSMRH